MVFEISNDHAIVEKNRKMSHIDWRVRMNVFNSMKRFTYKGMMLLLLSLVVFGCSSPNSTNQVAQNNEGKETDKKTTLLISAAASLSVVMEELITQFEAEHPTIKIEVNYGSSGTLQKQIEQGAPADLFISAGMKQMTALEEQNLVEASTPLLKNEIVVVGQQQYANQSYATLSQLLDDIAPKHIAIGETETVPAGQYAKQVLENESLWNSWSDSYVFAKDVRGVLSYVEQGNAEIGFVYLSDAISATDASIIYHIDAHLHDSIIYPVAVLSGTQSLEAAQLFYQFLQEEQLDELLEQNGFKRAE